MEQEGCEFKAKLKNKIGKRLAFLTDCSVWKRVFILSSSLEVNSLKMVLDQLLEIY